MADTAPGFTAGNPPLLLGDLARRSLTLTVVASTMGALAMWSRYGSPAGSLCLIATAALVTTSIPLLVRPRLSIIEPLWFVVLAVTVGVTGKAFYLFLGPPDRIEFLLRGATPADMIPAAIVIAVAMACFAVGYMLGDFGRRIRLPARLLRDDWSDRRVAVVSGVLVAAAMLSLLLLIPRIDSPTAGWAMISGKRFVRVPESAWPGAGGYLRWGASLTGPACLLLFAHWVAKKETASRALTAGVAAVGAAAIMSAIFFNSRRDLVFLVFALIIIWSCIRGEPRAIVAGGLGALTLALSGVMMALRAISVSDPNILADRLRIGLVLGSTLGSRHFLDLTKTARILDAYPQRFDYHRGETFFRWIVAPIPRSMWPAKPPIGVGKELGVSVFGNAVGTGVPPGIIAELHLNFGAPGIYLGMLVVGMLLRALYVGLASGFPNKTYVLVYAVVAPYAAFGAITMDVSGTIAALLQDLLPLLAAMALCAGRQFDTERH